MKGVTQMDIDHLIEKNCSNKLQIHLNLNTVRILMNHKSTSVDKQHCDDNCCQNKEIK